MRLLHLCRCSLQIYHEPAFISIMLLVCLSSSFPFFVCVLCLVALLGSTLSTDDLSSALFLLGFVVAESILGSLLFSLLLLSVAACLFMVF